MNEDEIYWRLGECGAAAFVERRRTATWRRHHQLVTEDTDSNSIWPQAMETSRNDHREMESGRCGEERVVTWRGAAGSVLKHNVRFLYLLGVWPACRGSAYHAFSALVVALCGTHMAFVVLGVGKGSEDLQETTLALTNAFAVSGGATKVALLLRGRRRFYALVRRLDRLVAAQAEHRRADARRQAAFDAFHRKAVRLTFLLHSYLFLLSFVWFPMPLIAQRGERRLPFVQLSWLDTSQLAVYAATYTLQCAGTFLLAFATVSVDCFFVAIMVHVSVQLRILSSRINALGLRTNLAGSARTFESDVSGEASDIQRDMYRELRLCIQYHQDILRFVRYLDSVMSPLAMTQFISGVLLACVALFQATLGEAVSLAAYSCGWQEAGGRFRRALRLLMSRAQKPILLTAGGVYVINRTTFISHKNEFLSEAQTKGHAVKQFRCEGGKEFKSNRVKELLIDKEAELLMPPHYTRQQDGVAERENRTVIEDACSVLNARKLPR
ncbi:odorant receptor 43a-like [Schistocerca gregaria]|uniref:odorant receptor 43a-like n=1 Tax=Schistocerca gregaria TaxID=7010 RepID=UPI00211EA3E4|nr:odorant receptor 43a-like [Schistocerca gregaria]